jgi:RNA polymerase primary sigma factor
MAESLQKDIIRSLNILNPRESEVVKMCYGIAGYTVMSLEEISERFSLSRERVRQIRENALRRLKNSRSRLLQSYLG